ncbi:MAG: DUF378 domain-containing protein [Candidatus Blackburnbacteria bacterium]|nr:DUF378 domain-containing protein [Candidatus Blackburnbacteria bacterium]
MKSVETVAWWLAVVGAVNWGLVGLGNLLNTGNWNLVQMVLGPSSLADIVYLVVGTSGLWLVWSKVGK